MTDTQTSTTEAASTIPPTEQPALDWAKFKAERRAHDAAAEAIRPGNKARLLDRGHTLPIHLAVVPLAQKRAFGGRTAIDPVRADSDTAANAGGISPPSMSG